MGRPSKAELLARFFPEIRQAASPGERQQSIAYNTLACEVVLADLLRLFDQGYRRQGPGVLAVRLQRQAGASAYLSAADLQADREAAAAGGDAATETVLADVLEQIGRLEVSATGLVLLIDNSSAQLFPIGRDYPARGIGALLEEHSS